MELLEKNWIEIVKRVVEPLWKYEFQKMYEAVKLDKDDFESLAGEELTKAFQTYNPSTSNVYTYARHVLIKKAKTELRDRSRDKRRAEVMAESIYEKLNDESNSTIEDMVESSETANNSYLMEIQLAEKEIYRLLNEKEKQIIRLSIAGFKDKDIATKLKIDTKEISNLRKKLNANSVVRRVVRKLGYLGGAEDEI